MAFWKKIFKSKYTGAEIDAAVGKAGNLPATTSADAGKALVVDEEGKIVAGEASGGSETFLIHCYTENMTSFVIAESAEEIAAAINGKKQLFLLLNDTTTFNCTGLGQYMVFQSLAVIDGGGGSLVLGAANIKINGQLNVTYLAQQFTLTPVST